jgi:hypothetical protein
LPTRPKGVNKKKVPIYLIDYNGSKIAAAEGIDMSALLRRPSLRGKKPSGAVAGRRGINQKQTGGAGGWRGSLSIAERLDCFASLAMTVGGSSVYLAASLYLFLCDF